VLAAIAGRFPGALFELDTLPIDAIEARAEALAAAAAGGATADWMRWMGRYHALVREELGARRAGRGAEGPRARATVLAIRRIAEEEGIAPERVERALFHRARRGIGR
jgi:hypothetical protein